MKEREKFGSRLGFILVSAGCAIGLGNVWKFPYMCGRYGGAAFILIYLVFLVILGLPIMVCEFSVGRKSRRGVASSFRVLEPEGRQWHLFGYLGILGNYLLMMFYTMVAGWMMYYFYQMVRGEMTGPEIGTVEIYRHFTGMLQDPKTLLFWTILVIVLSFGICSLGVEKGIEKINKIMMICLLGLIVVLVINSVRLPGAEAGVKFFLVPNWNQMREIGIGNVIFAAMSQAFFTLSIGMGTMSIFGSYIDGSRSLAGESITITLLDTFVALMAGLIVIPACFAYGIQPDAGPSLIFITLPTVFAKMAGGRIWGALFFLFLTFAALSTVIAVFENIVSFGMDLWGWSRKKASGINIILVIALSLPCILGYNLLAGFHPLGDGSTIMDLEDFLVSNNVLPLGSLCYLMFCTSKHGWGWDNFIAESNTGSGMRFSNKLRGYMTYILPGIIVIIYLKGYYDLFSAQGPLTCGIWMSIAGLWLLVIGWIVFGRKRVDKKSGLW